MMLRAPAKLICVFITILFCTLVFYEVIEIETEWLRNQDSYKKFMRRWIIFKYKLGYQKGATPVDPYSSTVRLENGLNERESELNL